jgi:ribonuclease BN (tRNA processing enzyme)
VIAGPPGAETRVRGITELFEYGNAIAAMSRAGLLSFIELEPGRAVPAGPATVTAWPARHTPEAIAIRVGYGGRTIAYSGDTGWTDALIHAADGADLFICQVYTYDLPADTMLSYQELRQHRDTLTCRRLILTHVDGQMLRHRASVTDEIAEDGMEITLADEGE